MDIPCGGEKKRDRSKSITGREAISYNILRTLPPLKFFASISDLSL